jgi:REP element-mobilizing transposase RayT
MARPWRIQYEDAVYHVMARGVAQGMIFLTEDDYHRFLECLERVVEKFHLEIFAFVLMGNHYHLFLRTPEGNLSRAIQWLQTSYTMYYNFKHNRCGHLFQGRYKSILVGEESYWQILSFYIHLNPIRAGIVKDINEYKWSSYHNYVRMKKIHKWVLCEEVLRGFGKDEKEQKAKYQQLIMETSGQEKKILNEIKYGLVLGSEEFVKWVQRKFANQKVVYEQSPYKMRKLRGDKVKDRVLGEIMQEFNIESNKLVEKRRGESNLPRDVGMYILNRYSGLFNKEIGKVFGVSATAVGKATIRVEKKMEENKEFQIRVEKILNSQFEV